MQAIETKYLGPTNYRGARIKARSESGRTLTLGYPYEARQGAEAHSYAAIALARQLGWTGTLHAGATSKGYVFVPSGDEFEIDSKPLEFKSDD